VSILSAINFVTGSIGFLSESNGSVASDKHADLIKLNHVAKSSSLYNGTNVCALPAEVVAAVAMVVFVPACLGR